MNACGKNFKANRCGKTIHQFNKDNMISFINICFTVGHAGILVSRHTRNYGRNFALRHSYLSLQQYGVHNKDGCFLCYISGFLRCIFQS
jgi:hypothetical protein